MTKPTKQCDSQIPQKCRREVRQERVLRVCYVRNQTDYRVAGNVVLSDAEIYIDSQRVILIASAIPRYKKKNLPLGLDKSLAQLEKYFIDTFLHIRQLVACCSAYVIYISIPLCICIGFSHSGRTTRTPRATFITTKSTNC